MSATRIMTELPENSSGTSQRGPDDYGSIDPSNTEGAALHEAIRTLSSNLSLEMVLQQVADLSKELVSAHYSALGIMGPDGTLQQFITSGISQQDRDRIGPPPEGKGLLGVVLREGQSLRLADLTQHIQSAGFPSNHPPMRSFLGVPITYKSVVLGNLYLTDKIGSEEFSASDENIVTLFAAQAAVAKAVAGAATGAAAAALGGYLRDASLVSAPTTVTIHQGHDMGRPSLLTVQIPENGGIIVSGTAGEI